MEKELHSERISVERKIFFFDLKENERGRFLKITEDVGGRRDTIIIPSVGLSDFAAAVKAAIEVEKDLPYLESRPPSDFEDDQE
jgi:hypothetical protein